MAQYLWFIVTCICFRAQLVLSVKDLELEKSILDRILRRGDYDGRIRPPGINNTDPLMVRVNTYVRSISGIDDINMEYDIQLTFRQSWVDQRLQFHETGIDYLLLSDPHRIWTPDIFISNEKKGHFHNIIMPNILVRIYPDGIVLYSIRISLTLSCPMNLKNYPMDSQKCSALFASYGYTTDDLLLLWTKSNPVQISKNIHLARFTLNKFSTDNCSSITNTGRYSCLKIDFYFSREVWYYIQNAYIPTIALVLLSWVPFWLNRRSTTVRMTIALGVLLALYIAVSSINASNPHASYTKAIDVWTGTCISFVFWELIMLCVIGNIVNKEEKANAKNQLVNEEALGEKLPGDGIKNHLHVFTIPPLNWLNRYSSKTQRLDIVCRILFPVAFIIFNFIYWLSYAANRTSEE